MNREKLSKAYGCFLRLVNITVMFFATFTIVGYVISTNLFPLQATDTTLINDLTSTLRADLRKINKSLIANSKYLKLLEYSICLQSLGENQIFIDSYHFSPMSLPSIIKPRKFYVPSAPLKDLYGYPLLQVDKKVLKRQYPEILLEKLTFNITITVSGKNIDLYSIAGLERLKHAKSRQHEIQNANKAEFGKLIFLRKSIIAFLIIFSILVPLILLRFKPLILIECFIVFIIGCIMLLLLRGHFCLGPNSSNESDFTSITKKHQKQIEQKLTQIIVTSYKHETINLLSYKSLVRSINHCTVNPTIIPYFYSGYSTGACPHSDSSLKKSFIKKHELSGCYN